MLLVLVTVILASAAMLTWDWWTNRPPAPVPVYDWARDQPLAQRFADELEADRAWARHFDQHGVLIFPKEAS